MTYIYDYSLYKSYFWSCLFELIIIIVVFGGMNIRNNKNYCESVEDLVNVIQDLKDEYAGRYEERLQFIVGNLFGDLDKKLSFCLEETPLFWIDQVQMMCAVVGPHSHFLSKIEERANNLIHIESQFLPQYILQELENTELSQSRILPGLKKKTITSTLSIRLFQWFFASILKAFMKLGQVYCKKSLLEDEQEDQLFTYLSKNIYLIFLRKVLVHFKQNSIPLFERLVSLINMFLVQELLSKFKRKPLNKQESHKDIYYKLKSHYLQLLYLIISIDKNIPEDTLASYYEYLIKITENYSQIANLSVNENINMIGRVWMALLCKHQNHETIFLDHLSKSNKEEGWFRLERIPLNALYSSIKTIKGTSKELKMSLIVKNNILKLIKRNNEWSPSFGMLRLVESIMMVNHSLSNYANQNAEQQKVIISASINRVLKHLFKEGKSKKEVEIYHQKVKILFSVLYRDSLSLNLDYSCDRPQEKMINSSQSSHCVNRFTPYNNNAWSYPLQPSQLNFLYKTTLKLSRTIDKMLGHEQMIYPKTNLRIFSNFFIILLSIIIIWILI